MKEDRTKKYEKPEVTKVSLVTEENVLQACKGPGAFGPDEPECIYATGGHCQECY